MQRWQILFELIRSPRSLLIGQRRGKNAAFRLLRWSQASLFRAKPWRTFRWYYGQRHYSGTYWATTERDHVTYESRLELANLILADFDPTVRHVVAQPFKLTGGLAPTPQFANRRRHRTRSKPRVLLATRNIRVGCIRVVPGATPCRTRRNASVRVMSVDAAAM